MTEPTKPQETGDFDVESLEEISPRHREEWETILSAQKREIQACQQMIASMDSKINELQTKLHITNELNENLTKTNDQLSCELDKIKSTIKSIHGDINKTRELSNKNFSNMNSKIDEISQNVKILVGQPATPPKVKVDQGHQPTTPPKVLQGEQRLGTKPNSRPETDNHDSTTSPDEQPWQEKSKKKFSPSKTINHDIDLLVVGNSHVQNIEGNKLYKFRSVKVLALPDGIKTIEGAHKELEKIDVKNPRVVLLHVSDNSLCFKSAQACTAEMHDLLKSYMSKFPNSKIVISEALPRLMANSGQTNRYMDNANEFNQIMRDVMNDSNLVITHPGLQNPHSHQYDRFGLHLTGKGLRTFVAELKLVVNPLLGMIPYHTYADWSRDARPTQHQHAQQSPRNNLRYGETRNMNRFGDYSYATVTRNDGPRKTLNYEHSENDRFSHGDTRHENSGSAYRGHINYHDDRLLNSNARPNSRLMDQNRHRAFVEKLSQLKREFGM